RTVPQDRPHRVHLGVAGRTIAAGRLDFLQDRASRAQGKPAAAVFFRDQRCEIARLRERGNEFGRIASIAIVRAPIFAGKLGTQRAHRGADIGEVLVLRAAFTHFTSARPLSITIRSRSITRARKLTTLRSSVPARQNSVRTVSPGNTGAEKRPDMAVNWAGSSPQIALSSAWPATPQAARPCRI